MVSALSRHLSNENVKEEIKGTLSCLMVFSDIEKSPCALKEFINSNADLPTIEELAKKSKQLAGAIGMANWFCEYKL